MTLALISKPLRWLGSAATATAARRERTGQRLAGDPVTVAIEVVGVADKVAVLGPNEGDQAAVQLFAVDGFAQQSTIDQAGPASAGMFAGLPGVT